MTLKQFTTRADDAIIAEFKAAAALRRITMWEALNQAMRAWVEQPEKKFSETSKNFSQNKG